MHSFCDAFRRTEDGSWVCVEPATLQGPGSRMQASPGDTYAPGSDPGRVLLYFMGHDVLAVFAVEQAIEADEQIFLRQAYVSGQGKAGFRPGIAADAPEFVVECFYQRIIVHR